VISEAQKLRRTPRSKQTPARQPLCAGISKADWELRRRQWADFNRWEREQPPQERTPDEYLAAMGALYEWLPEPTRAEERDRERQGVRRMHELFRLLSAR
jgi:hypothetical protein